MMLLFLLRRFYMMGFNIMAASHFDEYLVDFTSFKPGPIDASVFDKPALCEKHHKPTASADMPTKQEQQLLTAQAMSAGSAVMPWAKIPTKSHISGSSSSDTNTKEAEQQRMLQLRRLGALYQNQGFVEAWNQGSNAGFKLSLNRFASWLPEEYDMIRGLRSSSRSREVKEVSGVNKSEGHRAWCAEPAA